jgi:enoyl-CoA hydratase
MALVETTIDGRVAIVVINRPEAMNAFNTELLAVLRDEVLALGVREDVGALVLTGTGKSFGAGADIAEMVDYTPEQARAFSELGQSATTAIESIPQPVIAAVNGFALGGGCEMAMACDVRLCSESARFGQLEVNLGIMPGWGGTQRLARICGPSFALDLMFTGRMASADEALRCGLVSGVYPKEELLGKAQEMAATISSKSRVALRNIKLAAKRALEQDLAGGLRLEADLFGLCFSSFDQKEGMDAFLNKRTPEFKHQ